jgi:propionyl-CoA synthetase
MSTQQQMHKHSLADPQSYWAEIANQLHWDKRWDAVLDNSNAPFYQWFPGGQLNACYNAIDIHVDQGRGNKLP